MDLKNWTMMFVLVFMSIPVVVLTNNISGKDQVLDACTLTEANIFKKPHPFLCGRKMLALDASASDFALIAGISQSLGGRIVAHLRENPKKSLSLLIEVKGVGKKTLAKIANKFL